MFRRALATAGLCLALASPSLAAPDLALVLCGNDNSLATTTLPAGTPGPGVAGFAGYPGEGTVAGNRYYACVSGADHVIVFDLATLAPLDTLETGPGTNPFAAAVDEAGNVFVSLLLANEVVRFDAAGVETGRVPVGVSPQGILLHEGRLWVASTGFRFSDFGYDPGSVHVLDPATLAATDTVATGLNPQWLDAAPGEVHVVCTGDYFSVFGEANVIGTAGPSLDAVIPLGGSPGFLAVESGAAYTTDYFGGIYAYDVATRAVLYDAGTPLRFGGSGYSRLAGDGNGHLYVTLYDDDLLAVLETAGHTVIDAYPTGDGPGSVALREEMPVPVRLLSFTVETVGAGVRLAWTLAEDASAAGYRIERVDGDVVTRLADLPAGARSFTDPTPTAGEAAYRLLAEERDGTVALLGSRTVSFRPAVALRVRANPVRGLIPFALAGAAGSEVRLDLLDVRGRVVRSVRGVPGDGEFPLDEVAAGLYFLRAAGSSAPPARVVVLR